ncbi:MAG TPA: hypothetical protein VGI70_16250 [Polyangiales bacterium]|jgi:hypothetical protein
MKPRDPTSGEAIMRGLGGLVLGQLKNALAPNAKSGRDVPVQVDEPPVVAQLMIEIRSDGSRTIARGALNDLRSGESAQVHAEGRTPTELMLSLAQALIALPTSLLKHVRTDPNARDALSRGARPSDKKIGR